ncbi:MAG: PAS domain S-box protein, partial [bacterium]|nr:PAS domain S-box protein [bacterium]
LLERDRAERERDAAQRRFEILADNPALVIVEVDQTGTIEAVSSSIESSLGYSRDEVIGHRFHGFIHEESQQSILETFAGVIEGSSTQSSSRFVHKDGSLRTLQYAASPTTTEKGEIRSVAVLVDISERVRVETRAVIAEGRYRSIFESSLDGIAVLRLDGSIQEVNGSFARMLGYPRETLERMQFADCCTPRITDGEVMMRYKELKERGFTPEDERVFRRCDGSVFPVSITTWLQTDDCGTPLAVLTRTRDITHQKDLENTEAQQREELERRVVQRTRELEDTLTRLQRAERLASVGTLASGLAHQINNPIGSILNASEYALLCERDADVHETWKSALLDAVEQSKRCGRIVRSMLQYSRGEPTQRWVEDMGVVVNRAQNATRAHCDAFGASVDSFLADGPVPVLMNPIEMEQVIVNVLDNAIESNPEGASIVVQVTAEAGQARVEVTDDGRGIDPGDVDRVFDPFYTTRQPEGGTGLGLSVATGIVDEAGGSISVDAPPAGGTRVVIRLPLAD